MEPPPTLHPYATALRQRAATLGAFADAIERCTVFALPDHADAAGWRGPRADLATAMLARSVHQLHHAADDLRTTAHRFRLRADELDAAHRSAA